MDDTGVYLCPDKNELAQGKSVRVMETSWGGSAGEHGMPSPKGSTSDGRDAGWMQMQAGSLPSPCRQPPGQQARPPFVFCCFPGLSASLRLQELREPASEESLRPASGFREVVQVWRRGRVPGSQSEWQAAGSQLHD